jgi:hypothetical protein
MKMKQKEFRALKQVNLNGILRNLFELDLSLISFVNLTISSDFYPCYLWLSFQGLMTVTEYRDRFLQLACYALADIARDSDKQEYFKEGLDDHIQYALLNHRFDNFNQLVDAALNTERKRREIEDKKRKMAPSSSGSNTRPRYQHPPQQQQRPPQQYQQR